MPRSPRKALLLRDVYFEETLLRDVDLRNTIHTQLITVANPKHKNAQKKNNEMNCNCQRTVLFSIYGSFQYTHDSRVFKALSCTLTIQLLIPAAIHTHTCLKNRLKTRYMTLENTLSVTDRVMGVVTANCFSRSGAPNIKLKFPSLLHLTATLKVVFSISVCQDYANILPLNPKKQQDP